MQLTIKTTYPFGRVNYELPVSQIKQKVGHFEFKYRGPTIKIEQQETLNEMGLGNLGYLLKQDEEYSKRLVLEGIAKRAREGDRLVAEMTNPDTIAQLAKENSRGQVPEINVEMLPKTRPKIIMNYDLDVEWQDGGTQIEFRIHPVTIEWVRGGVEVFANKGSKIDIKG